MNQHTYRRVIDLRQPQSQPPSPPTDYRRFAPERESRLSSAPRIDWIRAKQELTKYGLSVACGIIFFLFIRISFDTFNRVQTANRHARAGIQSAVAGLDALNRKDTGMASKSFKDAQAQLQQTRLALQSTMPVPGRWAEAIPFIGPRYAAAKTVLDGAEAAIDAGYEASQAAPRPESSGGFSIQTDGVIRGHFGWFGTLAEDQGRLQRVEEDLRKSYQAFTAVNPRHLPKEIQDLVQSWQGIGQSLFGNQQRLEQILALLTAVIGRDESQEYLVVFQNNDEIRPTGGFIGSYALIKFQRGSFTITDAPGNGPYALKDLIPKNIAPPPALSSINSVLTFQDSNWFIDAPASSAILRSLYKSARGFEPDGVIFMTPEIIQYILSLTGPVVLPTTKTTISAETFYDDLETESEINYDRELNAPKQVIIELLPQVIQRLMRLETDKALQAVTYMMNELDQGNIILTSKDETAMSNASSLGWSGGIELPEQDALVITTANLGGVKSDRIVQTETELEITPSLGDWRHVLNIRRMHPGKVGEQFVGFDNRAYIRVTVPAGANLISIDGASIPEEKIFLPVPAVAKQHALVTDPSGLTFRDASRQVELSHELGGTTFGFWSIVKPGEEHSVQVTYTLPTDTMLKDGAWSLKWVRQPGSRNQTWRVRIKKDKAAFKPSLPIRGWSAKNKAWTWELAGPQTTWLAGTVKLKK